MSKVVVLRCESYDVDVIYDKLQYALEQLGGMESIIPKGQRILVNPNTLVGIDPSAAATTHPAVVEAVFRILQEQGYTQSYGDSPGFGDPGRVMKKCKIAPAADKYNVPLADFTNGQTIHNPEGIISKQFEIANAVFDNDAIINVCKMKSHAFQRITGAVKNPFGCVVGFHKGLMHSRFTNPYNFAEMIVDLANYLPLKLHIMDGIVAMEGNGPRNGNPTPMNTLLISTDPVALDAVFCKLINLKPEIIPTITYGQKYGLGSYQNIELIGDDITTLINPHFDIDRDTVKHTERNNFKVLRQFVIRRPVINEDICVKCGVCVEVCPLEDKAVDFSDGDKSNPPVYDYSKCIRCYCCQEMCPYHAIDTETPLIGKILYRTKILK
ncbi:DUF362 domain-containing protein [Candidatus Xianfuyuplasma coldseepsis]|uniref:DUF362 domain-containing protein n=1 Tax=Candidatus Xianfuyuplasma coldseepsis TaxID=2782163 RepID=A0A7L7KRE0_9MOLU|nr:DUF362 domain-containing protein [Xianfuyuplasma coldseepsis]QMS84776.1 DUF362 domain-containing protein [Xianfuyuplasma coldseepsis]